MKNMQAMNSDNTAQRAEQFTAYGIDNYAYLRSVELSELADKFQIEELEKIKQLHMEPQVWVLFSAEGMPIALSTQAADLHTQADELELTTVFLH